MNRCVIVANGQIDHDESLKALLESATHIVCVDGGLNYLDRIQIEPTVILGDFDSVESSLIENYRSKGVLCVDFPPRKDATDSELAIDYAIALVPDEIILLGMLGKRMDHGLTNLHLLKKIEKAKISASIWDAYNKIYYCQANITIKGRIGDTLSIIPISHKVTGITTDGLDYPLINETLYYDGSRGVSNIFVKENVQIDTSSGEFFIIIAKD